MASRGERIQLRSQQEAFELNVAFARSLLEAIESVELKSLVTCERCFSTAEGAVCPTCGLLKKCDATWTPILPPQKTGFFVDNPSPLAGLRAPAKFWIPGVP